MNVKKEYKTRYKDNIMEYLQQNKNVRFCASDVFDYMSRRGISINLTTVYRNLDKMTDSGILLRSKNPADECCFYQYAEPENHCEGHLHMQCRQCGKVIHLDGVFMEKLNAYVEQTHGFLLDCMTSMLSGVCESCRR